MPLWRAAYVRVTVVILVTVAGPAFLLYRRGVWLLFLPALLVADLAQPLMNGCARRLRARWLGLLVFVLGLFFAGLTSQVAQFSRQVPTPTGQVVAASRVLPGRVRAPHARPRSRTVILAVLLGAFLGAFGGGFAAPVAAFSTSCTRSATCPAGRASRDDRGGRQPDRLTNVTDRLIQIIAPPRRRV